MPEVGMPKFGSVRFSGVFAWTANQNRMAGRGCVEPRTGPAEPGSNSVRTELNLQFFVDVLSGKKERGEVLTSVCLAGKHAGGTCQVRNACLVVVSILTPAWCWWCRHFRAAGVMGNFSVKFSWLRYPFTKRIVDPQNWRSVVLIPTDRTHSFVPARTLICACAHALSFIRARTHPCSDVLTLPSIVWMPSSFVACTAIVRARTTLDRMVLRRLCLCVPVLAVVVCKHLVSI